MRLMPGLSKVKYQFYSSIDWLTYVLDLHKCKAAHQLNNGSANLKGHDQRDIYPVT